MKISISKQSLLTAINRVIKATASRPSVPYLSGVLITVSDAEVQLFASDLETSIQTSVSCLVEDIGQVAVPGKLLLNIVNSLEDTTIHLYEEGEFLKISAAQSDFEIRKIQTADFSDFPSIISEQSAELPADKMSNMIKRVSKAVSSDESRVVLTGILLTIEGEDITMVSTDSFRLALIEQKIDNSVPHPFEALIPGKVLGEVAKMIGGSGTVKIEASSNQVLFTFGDTKMITRRLEGRFPNYKQLIPSEFKTTVIVDHSELLATVRRVSLLALSNEAINVEVSSENQSLTLNFKKQDIGSAKGSMMVKVEGEDNTISINYSYLIDGLTSISTDTVLLEIQDPLRPGIVRAPEENFTYLVMPVRSQ